MQGLAALDDSRVRAKALPRAQGPAVAGVGASTQRKTQRIAFLEDDGECILRKLDIGMIDHKRI